jgi:hypothetical protein
MGGQPPTRERVESRGSLTTKRPASAPPPGPPSIGYLAQGPSRSSGADGGAGAASGAAARTNGASRSPSPRRDERPVLEQLRDSVEELWWEVQDPDRRKMVVASAIALGVLIVIGGYLYFAKLPGDLADDYRGRAQPAAERVADSMDEVYAAFDNYLDETDVPLRRVRNAEDFEEYRRRMLPIYKDFEAALRRGESAVTAARLEIGRSQTELSLVPSELFLGGTAPIGDAEDARALSGEYLTSAVAYLEDFESYVDYELEGLELARQALADTPSITTLDSANVDSFRNALQADLRDARQVRRAALRIQPPPDMERSHEVSIESLTINVDFFDDLLAAIKDLNQYAYVDAIEDFATARSRVARQEIRVRQAFESNSGLQDDSIRLTEMANELEAAIAAIGSGSAEDVKPRSRKRPAGPPPAHGRTGEGESQKV